MKIILHLDIKKISTDYSDALKEYIKRISPFAKVKLSTYKNINKLTVASTSKILLIEAGENTLTSPQLADFIEKISLDGLSVLEIIIPNPDNIKQIKDTLSSQCINYDILNISSFSMSVEMTATVATEQIYRAYTILNNIKYHK